MGSGNWTRETFVSYSTATKSTATSFATIDSLTGMLVGDGVSDVQSVYKAKTISDLLSPKNVLRECRDTQEHPETVPVILALDVTGSMGNAALEVAKGLNLIMEDIYKSVKDVEFCVMGIGDLAYDYYPVQISQFESDIRIAEQMDQVYFEFGGGGNSYESYTSAWYMGLHHTVLDCWNRGKKGIIITLGDENLNPYLPKSGLERVTGDKLQSNIETKTLYEEASEKFDIYHINVDHGSWRTHQVESFEAVLGKDHVFTANLNSLPGIISQIVVENAGQNAETNEGGISW